MVGEIKVNLVFEDDTEQSFYLPEGLGCFNMQSLGDALSYNFSFKVKESDLTKNVDLFQTTLKDIYNLKKKVKSIFVGHFEKEDGTFEMQHTYIMSQPRPIFYGFKNAVATDNGCSIVDECIYVVD